MRHVLNTVLDVDEQKRKNSMGDPQKHDSEWKKPDTEQYFIILFIWNSKKVKSIVTENRSVITADWLPRGPREPFWGMEMF